MKHTLNILVNNHPGVMSHVSGLFTRRSYNIDSIAVGVTENPDISSMTIVLKGDDAVVDQVKQQLLKLPDVLKVTDLFYMEAITRELVLLKVEAKDSNRTEIISLCGVFGSKIVDVTDTSLMIEFSGSARQVAAFITMMTKYGILEMDRTVQIALACQNG